MGRDGERSCLPRAASESVARLDYTRPTNDSPDSTGSGGPIPVPLAQVFGDGLQAAVSFATTEHFNLQTARAATVSEANGRASIYLAAVSSNLIALAFIGQMSRLGTAFYAFALILLPVLAFVGVVTFQRLVQSSIEDIAYAQRVARMRAFYLDVAPGLEPYLLVVRGPRGEALLHHESPRPSAWQLTLTTAGMVAVVNSMVIGACAGLAVSIFPIGSLGVALAAGAIAGVTSLSKKRRHHRRVVEAYRPEDIDRAATFVPATEQGDS
jgi:hypothetical protein